MPTLTANHAYKLSGMSLEKWGRGHSKFHEPQAIAGIYMGALSVGYRTWHGFQILADNQDAGAIFVDQDTFDNLTIEEV